MLNFLTKAIRAIRGRKVTAIESLFGGLPIHKLNDFGSYMEAGTRKVWATWKACDIVAKAVVDTPHAVYRKGGTDAVVVPDLARLLAWPNSRETFADLLGKSVFHLKLTGNAYWYKSEATLNGDRPREIIGLNPKRVKVVLDKADNLIGYVIKRGNEDVPFDLDEIIHFRQPHPDNDFYGLGDIEPTEAVLNEHINRNAWSEGFWKNGASPSGILIHRETITDEDAWQKAKAKWNKEYGGSRNSGKTAWLTGDWTYQQLGLSAQDMQNIEQSRLNTETIFILHGVPLSVVGVKEAANYATAEIDDQRFRAYTIKPLVKLFEDTINTDLIAGWGQNLELRFNVAGLVNVGAVVAPYSALFDRGVISLNEFRERVGMPRVSDNPLFEQHFISAGLVPLDLAGIADLGTVDEAAQRTVGRFIERTLAPAPKASQQA